MSERTRPRPRTPLDPAHPAGSDSDDWLDGQGNGSGAHALDGAWSPLSPPTEPPLRQFFVVSRPCG